MSPARLPFRHPGLSNKAATILSKTILLENTLKTNIINAQFIRLYAAVAKLADAPGLGPGGVTRTGSSPVGGTRIESVVIKTPSVVIVGKIVKALDVNIEELIK